jgi:hypothetical protein
MVNNIGWCEVPTHPGYYVNKMGQIKGPSGKILRPMAMNSGHLYVLTPKPRSPRKLFVHRAVLLAFKGFPLPGQESRHLDGNPSKNRLDNLEWGTHLDNMQDKQVHQTQPRGESQGGSKLKESDIPQIRAAYPGKTLRQIASQYGVSHTTILAAITGHHWRHVC